MEPTLKHRLIGAAVISALAIIFLPKLIVGSDPGLSGTRVPLKVPAAPKGEFQTQELPLDAPSSSVPAGGVVGMDTTHPAPSPSPGSPANDGAAPAAAASPASAESTLAASTPTPAAASANQAASAKVPSAASPATPVAASAATPPAAASPATPSASPSAAPAIPAAQAGGHYVVSLGTYSNAANAHALVASLRGKGLPAYADTVTMAGKPGTRVRIGPFQQRGDAEAARLRALQMRHDMPANVVALDAATPAAEPTPAPPPSTLSSVAKPATAGKPDVTPKPASAASGATSATAATHAPAATTRAYAVQVSAFGAERDANALRDKLHAAGFVAYTEKVHTASGDRWRVRVGPTAQRADADRLRTELSTRMNQSGMVVDYP